jgi:hypothetical protein
MRQEVEPVRSVATCGAVRETVQTMGLALTERSWLGLEAAGRCVREVGYAAFGPVRFQTFHRWQGKASREDNGHSDQ